MAIGRIMLAINLSMEISDSLWKLPNIKGNRLMFSISTNEYAAIAAYQAVCLRLFKRKLKYKRLNPINKVMPGPMTVSPTCTLRLKIC